MQTTTQNFVLTELTLPPVNVHAEDTGAIANITWMGPELVVANGYIMIAVKMTIISELVVPMTLMSTLDSLHQFLLIITMSLYTLKVWRQREHSQFAFGLVEPLLQPANMVVDQGFTCSGYL